jgi:hypothetical protein
MRRTPRRRHGLLRQARPAPAIDYASWTVDNARLACWTPSTPASTPTRSPGRRAPSPPPSLPQTDLQGNLLTAPKRERAPTTSPCVATRAGSDCRRRRRGPKVHQERGRAVASIARSASTRPGRSTPPEGAKAPGVRPGHQLDRCRHARPAGVATSWDAGSPALAIVTASLRRLRALGRGQGPVRSARRSGGGRRRGPPSEPHRQRRRP